MVVRLLAVAVGGADPVPARREDLFAGLVAADRPAGRGAAGAGLGRRGRGRLVAAAASRADRATARRFRGTLGTEVISLPAARPGGQGPGRAGQRLPGDLVPARPHVHRPGGLQHPAAGVAGAGEHPAAPGAGLRARPTGSPPTGPRCSPCRRSRRRPGGGLSLRLPRDHYVRLDGNDYSVHPAVIGRRVEVVADLDRVRVLCDGPAGRPTTTGAGPGTRPSPTPPARRPRPEARCAAPGPRPGRAAAAEPTSRSARLSDYDTAFGARATDADDGGGVMASHDARRPAGRDVDRRAGVPDPGAEGAHPARGGRRGWPSGPAPSPGPTRSSWPPACNARSPPGSPTAARAGSAPPGSRPARALEEFDFDHARGLKRDVIAHLGTLDFVAAKENVVFLGPPGTGKTHLATGLGDPRLPGRAPGRCSPPPPNGSPGSPTPTTPAASRTSSSGSAATRCWSSTRSATSRSNPRPRTCSSSSSPPATNAPA